MVPPTQSHQGQVGDRQLKSWELIPPSAGWMCEGDEVEGKKASDVVPKRVDNGEGIEKGYKDEKDKEEKEEDLKEDTPEEEMPAIPHAMDEDADKDYLIYLEELQRHPEYSPVHSSQAFAQRPLNDAHSQSSHAHSQPSYDLSGIWPTPVGLNQ
ncbi:hypothetical protein PIB30_058263 [Stylosanthes scabra]|uniref:Uncharacterized protein n=1 Tax=Stylosanthes scabra TaxID=79078 RepID=A0ABU6SL83_9FABA|nr:hypothetical protein [Stylosanthes scabra]